MVEERSRPHALYKFLLSVFDVHVNIICYVKCTNKTGAAIVTSYILDYTSYSFVHMCGAVLSVVVTVSVVHYCRKFSRGSPRSFRHGYACTRKAHASLYRRRYAVRLPAIYRA